MTTAPGHSGATTVGPQKSRRWLLYLALVAITAVGIAAVAMIVNDADTGVSTTPAVVAPVEVPAAAPALIAPVLEAPLSLEELALMNEAATGFDYSATIGDASISPIVNTLIASEAATSYISLEEYEFISEILTGLVPTGVLADEMAFSSGFDYSSTIGDASMSPIVNTLIASEAARSYISLEEYEFISEILRGLVPVGVLEDEMATP